MRIRDTNLRSGANSDVSHKRFASCIGPDVSGDREIFKIVLYSRKFGKMDSTF